MTKSIDVVEENVGGKKARTKCETKGDVKPDDVEKMLVKKEEKS